MSGVATQRGICPGGKKREGIMSGVAKIMAGDMSGRGFVRKYNIVISFKTYN